MDSSQIESSLMEPSMDSSLVDSVLMDTLIASLGQQKAADFPARLRRGEFPVVLRGRTVS